MGITPGGAASRAGVKRGDWILAVDGVAAGSLAVGDLLEQLRAKAGTAVRLTIRHGDVTREAMLTAQ